MDKEIILFGSGTYGTDFIKKHNGEYEVIAITDNDRDKWGKIFYGIKIVSPNELPRFDWIIIAIRDKDPIADQLEALGIETSRIFVYDAEKDEVKPYVRNEEYRLLIREAENRICYSLLKSAYDKGEFKEFKRIWIMGDNNHITRIKSFFECVDNRFVIGLFNNTMEYDEYDKIIITGSNYRDCVKLLRRKMHINDKQWLILPFFDIRSSLI